MTNQALSQVNNNLANITKRLAEIEATLGFVKKLYEEKEQLTLQLKESIGLNVEVAEGDYIFSVVDNFEKNSVVFKTTAVRRFDLNTDSHFARQLKEDKMRKKTKG